MKKLLALVLAAAMLFTLAFAAETGDTRISRPNIVPGSKIVITKDSFSGLSTFGGNPVQIAIEGDSGNRSVDEPMGILRGITSKNYSIANVKIGAVGKSLIEGIFIDDAEECVFVQMTDDLNNTYTKDFEIQFSLKGKASIILEDEAEANAYNEYVRYINAAAVDKAPGDEVVLPTVKFTVVGTVGYGKVEVYLGDDEEGEILNLDSYPGVNFAYDVFKFRAGRNVGEFQRIAGGANPSALFVQEFGDALTLKGRVYDGDMFYLNLNQTPDGDIVDKLAANDATLNFFYFRSETGFNTFAEDAKLYFNEADKNSAVYEVKDGEIVKTGAYSEEEGCWVVTTKTLGQYVVSSRDLTEQPPLVIPDDPEEILDMAETLDPTDPTEAEQLKDLEEAYMKLTGTGVETTADPSTHGDFKNQVDKISVLGAAFNVDPGETVSLYFSKPENDVTIDGTKYKTNSAVQLDISLRKGDQELTQLRVPVTITVPIPSGVAERDFWILHYAADGSYERITPTLNGDGTCSFTVTHFSVFVFVNDVNSTATPAAPAAKDTEKREKDDSNQQAEKAALEAVKAANAGKPGKVQNYTTAAGTIVPAVPVKLYGLSASLSVDAMETLAAGATGLNVNLDNGAAEVLIPAGFQMPKNLGVLGYSLGRQTDPLYTNLMKDAVKGDNAKTEVTRVGGGTMPTTVTVTIKTRLTGPVNVYLWDEDTRRATLVASPTAKDGKVTFATKRLGNFILTTGTIS